MDARKRAASAEIPNTLTGEEPESHMHPGPVPHAPTASQSSPAFPPPRSGKDQAKREALRTFSAGEPQQTGCALLLFFAPLAAGQSAHSGILPNT